MKIWLPKKSWVRAKPDVSKQRRIAGSKKKRVVSRGKATTVKEKNT